MKRLLYIVIFLFIFNVTLFAAADFSSAAVSYQFNATLSLGMHGDGVTALQTLLKEQGYYTYPTITGYFGPTTRSAVIAFQLARGLSPVGLVGPQTRAALNSLQSNPNQPPVVNPPVIQPTAKTFTRSLKLGSTGRDVTTLQILLKKEGVYSASITGYYGSATQKAVTAFQEKYAPEILAPIGYSAGTGSVGPATLTKLNALSSGILVDNQNPQPLPNCPAPDISSSLAASGSVGSGFSYTIYATQNPSSYSALNIPAGLSFSGQTISGTPTTNGTYPVTIRATNNCGTDSRTLTLTIGNAGAPTVQLSVSTTTVTTGTSATISWTSANASSCSAANGWSGSKGISGSENTGALTATKTFTITCTGTGGSITQSATITVKQPDQPQTNPNTNPNTPAPTVTITSNKNDLAYPQTVVVSWSSTNATSCTASGNWSGTRATSGTLNTLVVDDKTYTLSCTGPGGSANASVKVNVVIPIVKLSLSQSTLISGGSVTLSWTTDDVTTCTASGDWTGTKALSGSQTFTNLTANKSLGLNCTGPAGDAEPQTALITVINANAQAPTISISKVFDVKAGDAGILRWTTTDALYCEASGGWSGPKAVNGTEATTKLTTDTTFNLACGGPGGTTTKAYTLTVTPIPPVITLPSLDSLTAQNVLVIYNKDYSDSVALKDYYLQNRPALASAYTLGISSVLNEYIDYADYRDTIAPQITAWQTQNPSAAIKVIVLMNKIPIRTHTTADQFGRTNLSTQFMLNEAFKGAYVSTLDVGSQAASIAYIDKIASSNLIVSGAALGKSGSTYYFDDAQRIYSYATPGKLEKDAVLSANASASVMYDDTNHITTASDVTGYQTWGANGNQSPDYAVNGNVTFTGKSGWYLIKTIESYNGQYQDGYGQTTVPKWFAPNAFGGTNYSNTPVGAVTHTSEPGLGGVNNDQYHKMWEQGSTAAEAAWKSRMTNYFAEIGDPLVRK